jgi:hypothetical protein
LNKKPPNEAPPPPPLGVCHVAVVPDVAVRTCPELGAAALETLTEAPVDRSELAATLLLESVKSLFVTMLVDVGEKERDCHVAEVAPVAVRTCPELGATALETSTEVVVVLRESAEPFVVMTVVVVGPV